MKRLLVLLAASLLLAGARAAAAQTLLPDDVPSACDLARANWEAMDPSDDKRRYEPSRNRFQRFDFDCDSALSFDEYFEMQWSWMAKQDRDGDGVISQAEYVAPFCNFAMYVRQEGGKALCEQIFGRNFRMQMRPATGVIDRGYYRQLEARVFKRQDRNRDGLLTISGSPNWKKYYQ